MWWCAYFSASYIIISYYLLQEVDLLCDLNLDWLPVLVINRNPAFHSSFLSFRRYHEYGAFFHMLPICGGLWYHVLSWVGYHYFIGTNCFHLHFHKMGGNHLWNFVITQKTTVSALNSHLWFMCVPVANDIYYKMF